MDLHSGQIWRMGRAREATREKDAERKRGRVILEQEVAQQEVKMVVAEAAKAMGERPTRERGWMRAGRRPRGE